jgi:hypothetical protein
MRIGTTSAQDECSAVATQAIMRAQEACATIGSNEACYGYSHVEAEFQPDSEVDSFDEAGQLAPIADVLTLQTLPLVPELDEWGIALLQVQPDLPDVLPGQYVLFLLFGSAQIDRTADTDPDAPMSIFRLQTTITGTRCTDTPSDGLLIQTPEGAGDIAFTINGVNVNVGSTIWFEAQPDGDMTVRTLEGSAEVEVDGIIQIAEAGTFVTVPMDEDLEPEGVPSQPEVFEIDDEGWLLPLELLDEEIVLDEIGVDVDAESETDASVSGDSMSDDDADAGDDSGGSTGGTDDSGGGGDSGDDSGDGGEDGG